MPARWGTVAAYAAVAAANQLLWLTYAPITTDTAEHFGVSESAVGWLTQVFPLLYVLLAIPAGMALDRAFRPALLAGAWLTVLGGLVRLGDTYALALAGQILVAIAQPLILNAVTKVAVSSLPASRSGRTGSRSGSAGIFAGTALALPLAPGAGRRGVADALARRRCGVRGCRRRRAQRDAAGRPKRPARRSGSRDADDTIWRLAAVAFLGFGVFVALTTWLQAAARTRRASATPPPAGCSPRWSSRAWRAPRSLPPKLVKHHKERAFLRAAAIVAAAGCLTAGARARTPRSSP